MKHIPDITYNLKIYDIFQMYTRWNIYTNQMTVKNYIKTQPMRLETYTKGVENYTWNYQLCLCVPMGGTEG